MLLQRLLYPDHCCMSVDKTSPCKTPELQSLGGLQPQMNLDPQSIGQQIPNWVSGWGSLSTKSTPDALESWSLGSLSSVQGPEQMSLLRLQVQIEPVSQIKNNPAATCLRDVKKPKARFTGHISQPKAGSRATLEKWDLNAAWLLKENGFATTGNLPNKTFSYSKKGRQTGRLLTLMPDDLLSRAPWMEGYQTDQKTVPGEL